MHPTIVRLRTGDRDAREALVETLRPRIRSLAAVYARRSGLDSGDLQQEAWLGVLEALDGLDSRAAEPTGYLLKQARWRLLDAVRRRQRQRDREAAPLLDEPTADDVDASALAAVRTAEFVARLPAKRRRILELLADGFTWREIGDALGCTSANVAYHVRRIKHRWRDWSEEPSLAAGAEPTA